MLKFMFSSLPVQLVPFTIMSFSVDSLFNIVMRFVLKHITLVENFIGFPSLVGEELFKNFVLEYDVEKNSSFLGVFKKFVDAYHSSVLKKLNLFENLIILNEHFESIIVLSHCITELCVCGCSLGENHELYSHLSDFESLRKLCLRDNCMNDSSIRMFTLRTRMYSIGNQNIENLDLSGNNFTDRIVPYLTSFPKLECLKLSGSKLTRKALQTLESKYNLYQIFGEDEHKAVTTEGWAELLINRWIEYDGLRRKKKKKEKENKFFLKKHIARVQKPTHSQACSSYLSLVFQKLQDTQLQNSVPAKRQKLSVACDQRGIEEDLFSQYK